MSLTELSAGFIPLVDAAPLIVAQEIGFAREEGLDLVLRKAASWSALRDHLALGQVDAAHMLAPVPVAAALGLGGVARPLEALSLLSVNGNVIGVSVEMASRMRAAGHDFGFDDARAAGAALMAASERQIRIGVPFPFSMHAELVYHWLNAIGVAAPQSVSVRTVPPPLMAKAMEAGEIDAFCVGEPWGSIAVENGVGELLLPGAAIWSFAPEKVLATRQGWAEEHRDLAFRLIRALWRAGRWLDSIDNRLIATELLSRPDYLNLPPIVLERALTGQIVVSSRGETRKVENFVEFHRGVAGFPWRSQAVWIATRLAARTGLDRAEAAAAARAVFRSDLYREALQGTGADLPGASEKLEGAIADPTAVASQSGTLILPRNQFFDGTIFDPYDIS